MRRLALLLTLSACAPRLSPATFAGTFASTSASSTPTIPQPHTDDPDAPTTDLAGLRQIVGAARTVGLGQPGPGARELTRLHHRFLRFLVETAGFTGLALDLDATLTVALDRHVRGDTIDLDAALLALGDRTVATVELRDTLQWMRMQNQTNHADLRVFGLAAGDPDAAAALVIAWLSQVDPAYVPEARSKLGSEDVRAVEGVLDRLDERRADLIAASSVDAWASARQQAELVAQARRMAESWEYEAGEFGRARNVEWSLAQLGPQGKLVVWADNRRVAAEVPGNTPVMGDFLRQWLAADYRAIATVAISGSRLIARDDHTWCAALLPPARPGSLDAALRGPLPFTLVDLRALKAPSLTRPQRLRSFLGDTTRELRLRPAVAFDAIVGVQTIRPATPLATRQARASACYQRIGD